MSKQAAPPSDPHEPTGLMDLLRGRATARKDLSVHLSDRDGASLHDKMRQAYWWIINNAVLCPYYDLEYGEGARVENGSGDGFSLHQDMSYSSFVLVPLLTLFSCRRALMVGGPGRGKTTSAVLIARIAGMSREEIRRSILRGHPQLTVTDMLGAPLPSDMLEADDAADIKVSWRAWITQRVKIIDEYNRIPTKTQSALLSLMAEGFAEMFDQYVYAGRSAWFLTANDDAGGGTFAVIEALKDRIDVVVRAVPFNSNFVDALIARIEADRSPDDLIPDDVVFTPAELDAIYQGTLAVQIPQPAMDRVAYFLGQLDFCRMASPRFEFKNKDTLKLAGQSVAAICTEACPLDKRQHLCSQTENGVSARTYLTCIHFAKTLAYFRGHDRVELEDFRQILPFVLHDKLVPNRRSPFFTVSDNGTLLLDRITWIRRMFDLAMEQYERHAPLHASVQAVRTEIDAGLAGIDAKTAAKRIANVTGLMQRLLKAGELSGPLYEDLIQLKAIHSRYQNYLHWLKSA